jgi:hypothetical protein
MGNGSEESMENFLAGRVLVTEAADDLLLWTSRARLLGVLETENLSKLFIFQDLI